MEFDTSDTTVTTTKSLQKTEIKTVRSNNVK